MNVKSTNKNLIEKYPFLLPRNIWTDKPLNNYDYSFTELDFVPEGWRKAFGEQICDEILHILQKANYVNEYRIIQIKEKYGHLRWYTNSLPKSIYEEHRACINKYENISIRTCIKCGSPATKVSLSWISPWCDACSEERKDECIPIHEFMKLEENF